MKTEFELNREMMGAWGNWAFCTQYNRKHPGHYSKRKIVDNILVYRRARAALKAGEFAPEVNERGNTIYRDAFADKQLAFRSGVPSWEREAYDYGRFLKGWEHLPTWQDASYFGVYYDRPSRRMFTYAEGDRTLVECATDESFQAELDSAIAFYKHEEV